ncbi:TetR/AcrR family transcriptional regulator [Microbulbifer sp. YPW1]|uniref:TetR/AcrR family transcriptional regulator n=1 Tax=Microbulbifer sp. YPW1 TaxID=2745199 RepID=UPI001599C404|nr:TetR/AcrR family transcriptional regulator [Microbulbifer sp. YPW1]QKX15960.1 TetR/AcrR family transcriptional regulator [Microbulbifer sp. YPW1]
MSEQTIPTPATSSASRGRPKDPAKRRAILDAAKSLFLTHGFAGTSMDAVAGEAGVSKLTVYSHFSDKETLYIAAIEAKCENLMPLPMFTLEADGSAAEMLQKIGEAFLEMIYSEDSLRLMRLINAMGADDPDMAKLFYDAGPQRTQNAMASFFQRANELKQLNVPDPDHAAELFFGMLQGGCRHIQIMLGCCAPPGKEENRKHVAEAVQVFFSAYGV